MNNIPNDQSLLFENRELPGYSSDLNAQCRRAFGWNFEYCKNLSDAVNENCAFLVFNDESFSF